MMVSVVMITYGHEKFIREAVEGVLKQKCDFEVELIIANDASPDDTGSVVSNLVNSHVNGDWIKYTEHKTNKGVLSNFIWALQEVKGKYIAMCDGDDYWTDPYKLQKQVDFLESNFEVGLVTTLRSNYLQNKGTFTHPNFNEKIFKNYNFYDLLTGKVQLATLTSLFRTIHIKGFLEFYKKTGKELSCLDYCIFLYIAYHSGIRILNSNTGVYRIIENSLSHGSLYKTWDLKKKYFNDVQIYKNFLPKIDKAIFKIAEYDRAKGFYTMALIFKDEEYLVLFKKIFKENNDFLRIMAINLSKKSRFAIKLLSLFEKYIVVVKRGLLKKK